jgi:hypothetical protein
MVCKGAAERGSHVPPPQKTNAKGAVASVS